MRKQIWRLRKTLSRRIEVRPIEDADVRYAWAAYKKGALAELGEPYTSDLDAAQFKSAFERTVLTTHHAWWTISGETKNGFIPIGIVVGEWGPSQAFMIIVGISWFPWASRRNIVEGTVKFFDGLRKQMKWVGFATPKHKPLYEVCCMHAIMRRVGTTNMTKPPSAVFEGMH